MSNGSPQHDGQQQGQPGYRYGEYNEYGEFVEYPEYGTEGGGYPTGDYGTYGHGHDYGQAQQAQQTQRHQQAAPHSYPQQHGAYPSYPTGGWGGESDADATAFVQLPTGPLPPPGAPADAWGPLAAPGTGRGAYTPPPLDPNEVAGHGGGHHQPPAAQYGAPVAADEGPATGQWAMPFGEGTTLGGGWSPTAYEEYAQQYEQRSPQGVEDVPGSGSGQHPVPGAEPGGDDAHGHGDGRGPGQGPGPGPGQGPGQGPGGLPTGQGAAAALAGSHEARTRRPLGTRGGAAADETEPIGNTGQFSFPAAPQQSQPPEPAVEAHYAEAHARRRIQVPSEDRHDVPEPAEAYAQPPQPSKQPPGAPGTHEDGAASATPAENTAVETENVSAETPEERSAETPESASGPGAGPGSAPAGDTEAQDEGKGDQEEEEAPPRPRFPTVRSGLPFTPSTPSRGTTIPETESAPEAEPARPEAEPEPAGEPAEAAEAEEPATDDEHDSAEELDEHGEHGEHDDEPERPARTGPSDPELSEEPPLELAPELGGDHPHISYVLHVNSVDRPVNDAWIGESLLYVLRERLGLAGAKDGCSQGECGACSVQVDGRLVASCLVPAATAAGSEIRTVEGLAADGVPSDVQRALAESGAVQCGFCVPGLAMTVHDLLEGNHAPSELETRKAICGNLCRCSGYRGVLDAVRAVVEERAETAEREQAAAEAEAEAEAEAYEQGAYQESGYEQGAYEQGAYEQPGYGQGAYDQAAYDQGGVHIPQQQGPHRPGPDGRYPQQGGAV